MEKRFFKVGFSLIFLLYAISCFGQVSYQDENKEWTLETKNMSYLIALVKDKVYVNYYGEKIKGEPINTTINHLESAVRGSIPNKTPGIEVTFSDGTRDLDLVFMTSKISSLDGYPLLQIDEKDSHYNLMVSTFYRVLPEYDIIEKWIQLKNIGNENIIIEKLMSSSFWLPANEYELTQFTGSIRHEFQPKKALLTQGRKIIENRNFKSYSSSLYIVKEKSDEQFSSQNIWYGQVHYSGNWALEFDKQANGELQILSGINFWDTQWTLKAGQDFSSAKISFGFTNQGVQKVSQNYSSYIRNEVLPTHGRGKVRPVLYNSWYATEFDVNHKQQLELAKVAKKIGVEMFVIDDGWFKGRVNDKGGLGDWKADKIKFPNGLNPLIKDINKIGMDFGIWVEPEMVNPNSDLFRNHPNWIMQFANRKSTLGRNQLMLNLAREDVYQYLYQSLYDLLKNHNIKYLKWDMNKELTEPGWPEKDKEFQAEVRIRYVNNLYRLVDALRNEFPDLWIETCSSGGGRVDIGMFSRMDVAWASDNIDPVDRIYIQDGYLSSFPANTMVSWTGHEKWHGVDYDLSFRFDVAMSGVLGIGHDITKWTKDELDVATAKIREYKKFRETTHNGTLYKLASPYVSDKSVLQFVNEDKSEAIIFCYKLADDFKGSSTNPFLTTKIYCQGLDPNKSYVINEEAKTYNGESLMTQGIIFPLQKSFSSSIITIKEKY